MNYRIGFGVDFHALVKGRDLRIGGVSIPHPLGTAGHSDADVLLHALCDALLGAANLGDIGDHFPDSDPVYKDIDSTILLRNTMKLIVEQGYRVINLDTTLCLQEPRIKPYIPEMKQAISGASGIPEDCISIKATTTEKMGFVGRKEGVIAYATVLLLKS